MGNMETNHLCQTACKKFGNRLYFGDTDEIMTNQFRKQEMPFCFS
jgi:hypothetical protein